MSYKIKQFEKWQSRVRGIRSLYPFGPLTLKRDDIGRLHSDDGPAYISPLRCTWYQEGKKHGLDVDAFGSTCFYYENILVPPRYVNDPESLTFEEVMSHKNTEVRYVGMQIYGYKRMREEGKFKILDADVASDGSERELLQCEGVFTDPNGTREPIVLVKVVNSSPNPDGTFKPYFLKVPPDMKTCQEAVAWTFRKPAEGYVPAQET